MKELIAEFVNPGSEFRGAPFWAWNGRLEPAELRRQVRLMKKMGLGGFFMHSRVGLDTAYLGDQWFEAVEACLDEAAKSGMRAWLYDEDRWPSGAAGGMVTENPKYRMRKLRMRRSRQLPQASERAELIALFKVELIQDSLVGYQRLELDHSPGKLADNQEFLSFQVVTQEPSSWYNDQTYLDTMDREAVARFIQVTHEQYRERIGQAFGQLVPGIFTDEPNYGRVFADEGDDQFSNPWSRKLAARFVERYGYDLLDFLPELFYDWTKPQVSRARYHYYDCLTHMFVEAFARQIGEWCEANQLLFTGHVLSEGSLSSQVQVAGSCLRFYEYMQAPGIDLLTEHWRIYDTAKQVSSAARQFGRKWRLSETYGCTGWDFPLVGHKALGDWQVALGINLRCQHLAWYTMQGQAKRDYPASISYQSPWWDSYSKIEDYFARIHAVMTRGREVRDILVIHPVESMWTMTALGQAGGEEIREYDRMLANLSHGLLAAHLDFDYGDEEIISRHGRLAESSEFPAIQVGQARYGVVVVPPLRTMRGSTIKLLRKFRDQGGTVVFLGTPPDYVDAEPNGQAAALAADCIRLSPPVVPAEPALLEVLETKARRVSIKDGDKREIATALYLLRESEEGYFIFVCNTGHRDSEIEGSASADAVTQDIMVRDRGRAFPKVSLELSLATAPPPLQLDPETGRVYRARAVRAGDGWKIETSLPQLASRLFFLPTRASADFSELPEVPVYTESKTAVVDPARWELALTEDNVMVLDRPAWRMDGGEWRRPLEILRLDQLLRHHLGVPPRGGRMVQPWARPARENKKTVAVGLDYEFTVEALPRQPVRLALEQPDLLDIRLNGHKLSTDMENGWWCDRSLKTIPLPLEHFCLGKNHLQLHLNRYGADHSGLEIVYLLGSFGVEVKLAGQLRLQSAPTTLEIGDWTKQGLPFYAGSVLYRTTVQFAPESGERVFLVIPEYRGAALRVLINEQDAGLIAWPPHELEIGKLLEPGENRLAIEVLGHRRNSHGPLHHSQKWPAWTGASQFTSQGDLWRDNYQLVPCGLSAPPILSFRQGH